MTGTGFAAAVCPAHHLGPPPPQVPSCALGPPLLWRATSRLAQRPVRCGQPPSGRSSLGSLNPGGSGPRPVPAAPPPGKALLGPRALLPGACVPARGWSPGRPPLGASARRRSPCLARDPSRSPGQAPRRLGPPPALPTPGICGGHGDRPSATCPAAHGFQLNAACGVGGKRPPRLAAKGSRPPPATSRAPAATARHTAGPAGSLPAPSPGPRGAGPRCGDPHARSSGGGELRRGRPRAAALGPRLRHCRAAPRAARAPPSAARDPPPQGADVT